MSGTGDYVGIVAFLVICVIVALGWGLIKLFNLADRRSVGKMAKKQRGYGINYMMRRRRLDLSNPNGSFRTTILAKIRRQRTGLFRRRSK